MNFKYNNKEYSGSKAEILEAIIQDNEFKYVGSGLFELGEERGVASNSCVIGEIRNRLIDSLEGRLPEEYKFEFSGTEFIGCVTEIRGAVYKHLGKLTYAELKEHLYHRLYREIKCLKT